MVWVEWEIFIVVLDWKVNVVGVDVGVEVFVDVLDEWNYVVCFVGDC